MNNIALISLIIMTYSTQIFHRQQMPIRKYIRSKVSESGTSARITERAISSRNIVSITKIEDLCRQDLSDNKITDFSPIKRLKTKESARHICNRRQN